MITQTRVASSLIKTGTYGKWNKDSPVEFPLSFSSILSGKLCGQDKSTPRPQGCAGCRVTLGWKISRSTVFIVGISSAIKSQKAVYVHFEQVNNYCCLALQYRSAVNCPVEENAVSILGYNSVLQTTMHLFWTHVISNVTIWKLNRIFCQAFGAEVSP